MTEAHNYTLLDAVAAPLLVVRQETILYVNRAASKLLGYSSLSGISIQRILHPDWISQYQNWQQEYLDLRLLTQDKKVLAVRLKAEPIGDGARIITVLDYALGGEIDYRNLVERSPDIVVITDDQGHILYTNESLEVQLGYSLDELIDTKSWDLVHPDDLNVILQSVANYLTASTPPRVEFRIKHKNGRYIWMEAVVGVDFNARDNSQRVISVAREIQRRKEAEAALRASEAQLRLITDHMRDMIVTVDPYGLVTYATPSVKNLMGVEPASIIGQSMIDNIHPDDIAPLMNTFLAAQENQSGTTISYRVKGADGEYRWVESVGNVVWDAMGKVQALVSISRDVTERRQAEAERKAVEDRLRLITDTIQDIIVMVDADLTYRYVSPSVERTLGYKPEELIGQPLFIVLHPDDMETSRSTAEAVIRGESVTLEVRCKHADGYYVWTEALARPIMEGDRFSAAVVTVRDISERRWMQRALVEQERLVTILQKDQELSVLKSRMMSRLSHELRTPLAIITTSADMLERYHDKMQPEQRQERLYQIRNQVGIFTAMLDDMSLVFKGISFKTAFAPTPYAIQDVVSHTIREVKEALKAQQSVVLNLNSASPTVHSDQQVLRLVLMSLVSNALKYSAPESIVQVRIDVSENDILLTVEDQGIGIPAEDQNRIFEPFFRASNVDADIPGLGIGLSLVEEVLGSTYGVIDVVSSVGKGTTVSVQIPLRRQPVLLPQAESLSPGKLN
jgi:PAS domain S-box-containing protein